MIALTQAFFSVIQQQHTNSESYRVMNKILIRLKNCRFERAQNLFS